MANDNSDNGRSVAMYWDFENLHAGVLDATYGEGTYAKQDNRFKPQEPLIDVQALVESPPPSVRSPSTAPTATGSSSVATETPCCRTPSS